MPTFNPDAWRQIINGDIYTDYPGGGHVDQKARERHRKKENADHWEEVLREQTEKAMRIQKRVDNFYSLFVFRDFK